MLKLFEMDLSASTKGIPLFSPNDNPNNCTSFMITAPQRLWLPHTPTAIAKLDLWRAMD